MSDPADEIFALSPAVRSVAFGRSATPTDLVEPLRALLRSPWTS